MQIAAFNEAQVYRLQHGQEGSAGEERFASPSGDGGVGMTPTRGSEVCSSFPREGWLLLAVDSYMLLSCKRNWERDVVTWRLQI